MWTLTVDYYDVTDTHVFGNEADAMAELRKHFGADHDQWESAFTQDELDRLTDAEFRESLVDYSVFNEIKAHQVDVS